MSKKIDRKKILLNKLKIKYLKKYLRSRINLLKKIQKNHTQHGGQPNPGKENKEDEKKPSTVENIRVPGLSSFFQDAPEIMGRAVRIFWRCDKILTIAKNLSDTYDESGESKKLIATAKKIMETLKVFIILYGGLMKLFSGKWNEKILKTIAEFEKKEIQGGGGMIQIGGEQPITIETAQQAAALAAATRATQEELVKRTDVFTNKLVPKVFEKHGNPFDKINKTISNVIAMGFDAIGTAPGLNFIVGPIKILDKVTKTSADVLGVIESQVELAEETLKENAEWDERQQKWIIPLLENVQILGNLAQKSPGVAKLLQEASQKAGDNLIDNAIPKSDSLMNVNWIADAAARKVQSNLNEKVDNLIANATPAAAPTAPAASVGGSKTLKRRRRKRKIKTLKKKNSKKST